MVKAQNYLDENYPKNERTTHYIELANKNLERHLDLSDFVNLKNLWCSNNQITSLDISENKELQKIELPNNKITANISIFSHLTKLYSLNISSENEESKSNDFVGSLKAFKDCQWLRILNIDYNEKITEGLEYLPNEMESFSCKGTAFEEMLKPFRHDITMWKLVNHPNHAAESPEKLIELFDYEIGHINGSLRGLYNGSRTNDEEKSFLENKLKILTEHKEKATQAFSHKMVERTIEENKKLKNKVEELEKQVEQLKLETKIEQPLKK